MRTSITKFLAGTILLLLATAAYPATYYVKNGGNDGAAGTDDTLAWASLSKVNNTSFSPGDSILFKRGSSWSGALIPGSAGSSDSLRITYGAYGSGALPIIDGGTSVAVTFANLPYVTLQYLDLRGSEPNNGTTILVTNTDYMIIEYCEIGRAGVRGLETGDPANIDGLVIRNNTFDAHQTSDGGDGGTPGEAYDGLRLQAGLTNARVYGNTFVDWGHAAINMTASASPSTYGNWFYGNTIYQRRNVMIYGRCFAFDVQDPNATGNKVFNNYCYGTRSTNQFQVANGEFFYNIITDATGGLTHFLCLSIDTYYGYANNVKIYNNVFANCGMQGLLIGTQNYPVSGIEVKNNVIYGNDRTGGYNQIEVRNQSSVSNLTIKNNIIYKSGVSSPITYRGTAMNATTFNTADSNGDVIEGNIQADPLFVNPVYGGYGSEVMGDFHLLTGSPAINAGIDVGLTTDYSGSPIVGLPDIGAYEYGSGAGDQTPPERYNSTPGFLPNGTTQYNLTLSTNENATCKYDNVAGTAYASMPNTFGTTGGTSHSSVVGATSYSDNFNRADENPLAGGWTKSGTSIDAMKIVSNQVFANVYGVANGAYYSNGTFASDQFSKMTVGGAGVGPMMRIQPGQTHVTGYQLLEDIGPYAGLLTIWEGNGDGSFNLLDSVAGSVSTGDTLEIRAIGNSITTYKNDVLITGLNAIDSTYPSGYAGIYSMLTTGAYGDGWTGGGLNALVDGQTYYYYVRCMDASPSQNVNPDDYLISFQIGGVAHTLGSFELQGAIQ